jgi:Domain of unknown function (DUF6484)
MNDRIEVPLSEQSEEDAAVAELQELLAAPVEVRDAPPSQSARTEGVVVGTLVGMRGSHEPLVVYPGQPGTAAIGARTTVDLHGVHIGHEVTLMFEGADPLRPIVMGCIRGHKGWPLDDRPGQIEVDADGERLIVSAKEQLVLRCGKATITLTKAGKVLIHGTYLLSRSSGVNRIKGGSVQLN